MHQPELALDRIRSEARAVETNIAPALEFALRVGATLPPPGSGRTLQRWGILAAAGEGGLTAARVLEAHSDALAILAEAGESTPEGTWGVFAAEAPGVRLDAVADGPGVRVTGTKPWCSLGGDLDAALVTAHVGDRRQLFAVDLRASGVRPEPAQRWVARGLSTVTSAPVHFDDTPARPVGGPGWYLERSGFAWGGIGVAACWFGGARGLHTALRAYVSGHDNDLAAMHLGVADQSLYAAEAVLHRAADVVDAGTATGAAGELLALRVRGVVADAVETCLRAAGHALGPAPLAFDDEYARRVADLELYVRQHHGERDHAALGRAVVKTGS